MDLRACLDEVLTIAPGETRLIPTGFAMHMKDTGMAAVILPRSARLRWRHHHCSKRTTEFAANGNE